MCPDWRGREPRQQRQRPRHLPHLPYSSSSSSSVPYRNSLPPSMPEREDYFGWGGVPSSSHRPHRPSSGSLRASCGRAYTHRGANDDLQREGDFSLCTSIPSSLDLTSGEGRGAEGRQHSLSACSQSVDGGHRPQLRQARGGRGGQREDFSSCSSEPPQYRSNPPRLLYRRGDSYLDGDEEEDEDVFSDHAWQGQMDGARGRHFQSSPLHGRARHSRPLSSASSFSCSRGPPSDASKHRQTFPPAAKTQQFEDVKISFATHHADENDGPLRASSSAQLGARGEPFQDRVRRRVPGKRDEDDDVFEGGERRPDYESDRSEEHVISGGRASPFDADSVDERTIDCGTEVHATREEGWQATDEAGGATRRREEEDTEEHGQRRSETEEMTSASLSCASLPESNPPLPDHAHPHSTFNGEGDRPMPPPRLRPVSRQALRMTSPTEAFSLKTLQDCLPPSYVFFSYLLIATSLLSVSTSSRTASYIFLVPLSFSSFFLLPYGQEAVLPDFSSLLVFVDCRAFSAPSTPKTACSTART